MRPELEMSVVCQADLSGPMVIGPNGEKRWQVAAGGLLLGTATPSVVWGQAPCRTDICTHRVTGMSHTLIWEWWRQLGQRSLQQEVGRGKVVVTGPEEAQTSGSVGVSGSVGCGGIGSPC